MIKYEHLKKACKELGFNFETGSLYMCVCDDTRRMVVKVFPYDAWGIIFTYEFNVLESSEKAKLIKAITKDYEEFMHGDE